MSGYQNNSIFWIEVSKIEPNPFQPRREFEPHALEDLADSIRQYGVLQPLVVTRTEDYREDGGMEVSYLLIAGERRLRASRIAGLHQVPVIIRKETDNKVRLELAIIENLQREDLNPIDRALAFEQLYKEFSLTHAEIGKKMGKSRVYVSNSLRLLSLPDDIKKALTDKKITEGHTRPLLMLTDRPEEQQTLFKEIVVRNMSVRDAEKIARKVAQDKIRKKEYEVDPKIRVYEKKMSENLGTRVHIEPKDKGGKIVIDYFTLKDLDTILLSIKKSEAKDSNRMIDNFIEQRDRLAQDQLISSQKDSISDSIPVSFDTDQGAQKNDINKESVAYEEPKEVSSLSQSLASTIQQATHEAGKEDEISIYKDMYKKEVTSPVEAQHDVSVTQNNPERERVTELPAEEIRVQKPELDPYLEKIPEEPSFQELHNPVIQKTVDDVKQFIPDNTEVVKDSSREEQVPTRNDSYTEEIPSYNQSSRQAFAEEQNPLSGRIISEEVVNQQVPAAQKERPQAQSVSPFLSGTIEQPRPEPVAVPQQQQVQNNTAQQVQYQHSPDQYSSEPAKKKGFLGRIFG